MTYIMRPSLEELTEVYLYRQAIDFRKSHRGLAARLSHKNFTCLSIDSRVETESAKLSMAA